ncbi:MAG TPA: nucleotidyl transferase AbiEii/AbiGii toxin family protein [Bacteroidales bacterium]|nr:nucleotidyl transferase AbiEii/AbiGii toxin family protein [Bacteroidales bacterium]HPI68563.1 nucleotidyl transferase AbiEii/AbiGii toxin family protein [Bacteroidales bacterium]HPR72510.1 nucleotidyl transferase AbiEii/AbiGii toxin family protein [Bacteroidales bacterium]HRW85795.1 nucleotidyl transferase AbiEii/AbiGii toxin family protein [Bacteroidales bacterium]
MLQKEAVSTELFSLIQKLQKDPSLGNFILAGGTALALHLGHRKSEDIDLFTKSEFDVQLLLEYLENNYGFRMNFQALSTLKGSINNVRIDFIAHKYPDVKVPSVIEAIRIASIEDIAAMKVNAISGDGTRVKDFIDIYFLLEKYSFGEILGFFSTKYNLRNNAHALKSLTWFEDADLNYWPVMIREPELTFEQVKKKLTRQRDLFLKTRGIG